MAYEQVRMRVRDGQEFGPVTWGALLEWRRAGRVPDDAVIIDHPTGESQPALAFYALRHTSHAGDSHDK